MNKILVAILIVFCSTFSTLTWAELSYDMFKIEYQKQSTSGDPDTTGFGFSLMKGVANNVFFEGNFYNASTPSNTTAGDIKSNGYGINAGFHTPITANNVDMLITGGFHHSSAELAGNSASGSGYQFSGGIRAEIAPQIETVLLAHYQNTDISFLGTTESASTTGFSLDLGYKVTPQFEISVGLGSYNTDPQNSPSYSSTTLGFSGIIYY